MKIKYDKEADALYFQIKNGTFNSNKKIDEHTILDLDKEDNIIGIEFLEASSRIPKKSLQKAMVNPKTY